MWFIQNRFFKAERGLLDVASSSTVTTDRSVYLPHWIWILPCTVLPISMLMDSDRHGSDQCDQICRFLNVHGDKSTYKSGPNIWRLFGYFDNCGYYLGYFWRIWTTFYSNIWSHWQWPLYLLLLLCKICDVTRFATQNSIGGCHSFISAHTNKKGSSH